MDQIEGVLGAVDQPAESCVRWFTWVNLKSPLGSKFTFKRHKCHITLHYNTISLAVNISVMDVFMSRLLCDFFCKTVFR